MWWITRRLRQLFLRRPAPLISYIHQKKREETETRSPYYSKHNSVSKAPYLCSTRFTFTPVIRRRRRKKKKASRWLMSEYRLGGWDESAPSRKWKGIKYRLVGSQEQQPRDGQPPCSNNSNSPPSPPKGMLCCAGPSSSYSMLYHPAAAHVRRASYWFGRPFRVCASISRRSQLSSSNSQKERERERERHYGSCRPMSLRRGKHGRLKRLQDAPLATVLTTAIQSLRLEVMDRQRINGTYNAHVP